MTSKTKYHDVLSDLRSKKEEIEIAIKAIQGLMGSGEAESGSKENASKSKPNNSIKHKEELPQKIGRYSNMTILEATKDYLASIKKPKSSREIADILEKHGFNSSSKNLASTVHITLLRAEKRNDGIIKVDKNWGLKEWEPQHYRNDFQNIEFQNNEQSRNFFRG